MRGLKFAVALVVVVDFLVAVVQMQQAIIERASFQRPSVTTYGQYAVTMTSHTTDDVDLYVRDPSGDICWYGALQTAAMSLQHDQIPGVTDPRRAGVHELTMIRESARGEYVANAELYEGGRPAVVTVQLWDLRGLHKRLLMTKTFTLHFAGQQHTAFRWRLDAKGDVAGFSGLPANLLGETSRRSD
ncbi:MAG TPA: hypothetical protein VHD91_05250 [Gaiellaceae bacterium]|nr:hypothetical protein [Gaiellaceae bacterium]